MVINSKCRNVKKHIVGSFADSLEQLKAIPVFITPEKLFGLREGAKYIIF